MPDLITPVSAAQDVFTTAAALATTVFEALPSSTASSSACIPLVPATPPQSRSPQLSVDRKEGRGPENSTTIELEVSDDDEGEVARARVSAQSMQKATLRMHLEQKQKELQALRKRLLSCAPAASIPSNSQRRPMLNLAAHEHAQRLEEKLRHLAAIGPTKSIAGQI